MPEKIRKSIQNFNWSDYADYDFRTKPIRHSDKLRKDLKKIYNQEQLSTYEQNLILSRLQMTQLNDYIDEIKLFCIDTIELLTNAYYVQKIPNIKFYNDEYLNHLKEQYQTQIKNLSYKLPSSIHLKNKYQITLQNIKNPINLMEIKDFLESTFHQNFQILAMTNDDYHYFQFKKLWYQYKKNNHIKPDDYQYQTMSLIFQFQRYLHNLQHQLVKWHLQHALTPADTDFVTLLKNYQFVTPKQGLKIQNSKN